MFTEKALYIGFIGESVLKRYVKATENGTDFNDDETAINRKSVIQMN